MIVEFPSTEFVLRCRKCKMNPFYVILGSNDPYDFKHLECVECGDLFFTEDSKKLMDESWRNMEKPKRRGK